MKIVCHRGYWKKKQDQNTLKSIKGSFHFDGVEIDLRSINNKIVLSHDPLLKSLDYCLLSDALKLKARKDFFWAFNIKEDGLGKLLTGLIEKYSITNYMCFDLSFPEQVAYKQLGLRVFDRCGDRELSDAKELVFDCFDTKKFSSSLRSLSQSHKVFVISPELHGATYKSAWSVLKKKKFDSIMLCTDFPEDAHEYFAI